MTMPILGQNNLCPTSRPSRALIFLGSWRKSIPSPYVFFRNHGLPNLSIWTCPCCVPHTLALLFHLLASSSSLKGTLWRDLIAYIDVRRLAVTARRVPSRATICVHCDSTSYTHPAARTDDGVSSSTCYCPTSVRCVITFIKTLNKHAYMWKPACDKVVACTNEGRVPSVSTYHLLVLFVVCAWLRRP